ncbi:IS66 family insertion sequence element accessory protein TnpB [uncultured Desulfobacter sp.]|uniref:IS66 family insertion sequence element accessory protein TnpB n=1 Tax=uncultured Desulfobacter sp. TaxID=240139 RepID=UPI003749282A
MRKSIDGLSILVSEKLNLDPLSGHMFVFCNRKQNILKILYWDRNGFCLWHNYLSSHYTAFGSRSVFLRRLNASKWSYMTHLWCGGTDQGDNKKNTPEGSGLQRDCQFINVV